MTHVLLFLKLNVIREITMYLNNAFDLCPTSTPWSYDQLRQCYQRQCTFYEKVLVITHEKTFVIFLPYLCLAAGMAPLTTYEFHMVVKMTLGIALYHFVTVGTCPHHQHF